VAHVFAIDSDKRISIAASCSNFLKKRNCTFHNQPINKHPEVANNPQILALFTARKEELLNAA
jgi:hypothetical protein